MKVERIEQSMLNYACVFVVLEEQDKELKNGELISRAAELIDFNYVDRNTRKTMHALMGINGEQDSQASDFMFGTNITGKVTKFEHDRAKIDLYAMPST